MRAVPLASLLSDPHRFTQKPTMLQAHSSFDSAKGNRELSIKIRRYFAQKAKKL
jgi:hypothetical protein